MTVPTTTDAVQYTGNNSTTVFSTVFVFLADTEVKVTLKLFGDTVFQPQTLGLHYTIAGAHSGSPGAVTFTNPPAMSSTVLIERDVPFTQLTSLRTSGPFSPGTHEDALDRAVMRDQELDRRITKLEGAGAPGAVVAGNGLVFSTATQLDVYPGPGLTVTSDSVSVVFGDDLNDIPDVTGAGADAGILDKAARVDHTHGIQIGAPGTAVAGGSASTGVATSVASSDHEHAYPVGTPVNVTKATAVAGASGAFADSAHKHDVDTAAAIDLTDSTNAEGVGTSLARNDHTHAHGTRGGGTLHAVATSSANGFMSAADKAKLDNYPTTGTGVVRSQISKLTSDATPVDITSWTPADQSTEVVTLRVVAMRRKTEGTAGAGYFITGTFRRVDGVLTQIGSTRSPSTADEDTAGWDIGFSVATPVLHVVVTGAAASNILWNATLERIIAISP